MNNQKGQSPYMGKKEKEKSNEPKERNNPSAIIRKQHIKYEKQRVRPR
jgi:hypothetical protein